MEKDKVLVSSMKLMAYACTTSLGWLYTCAYYRTLYVRDYDGGVKKNCVKMKTKVTSKTQVAFVRST